MAFGGRQDVGGKVSAGVGLLTNGYRHADTFGKRERCMMHAS